MKADSKFVQDYLHKLLDDNADVLIDAHNVSVDSDYQIYRMEEFDDHFLGATPLQMAAVLDDSDFSPGYDYWTYARGIHLTSFIDVDLELWIDFAAIEIELLDEDNHELDALRDRIEKAYECAERTDC